MRISDWSSDVCSSDLPARGQCGRYRRKQQTCDNGQHPEIDCGTCHDGSQAQHAHCYMPAVSKYGIADSRDIRLAALRCTAARTSTANTIDSISLRQLVERRPMRGYGSTDAMRVR